MSLSSVTTSLRRLTLSSSRAFISKPSPLAYTPTCMGANSSMSDLSSFTRSVHSGRSKRGLYEGKDISSGNNVSFSNKKTRRKFKPNVFKKKLYSEILNESIIFSVTTSALRTMDKVGGLDKYLLKSPHVHKESNAWKVRNRIHQRMEHCEKNGIDLYDPVVLPVRKEVIPEEEVGEKVHA